MLTVAELVARLRMDGSSFTAGSARAVAQVQAIEHSSDKMAKVTKLAFGATAIAVAGAATQFVRFDSTMTKLVTLAGVSEDAMRDMSAAVLEMAPAVGKTPQELAEGLYFVASAGFTGAKALEVLEASAKGAAVGLGTVEEVADAVTSVMNAYGQETMSAAEVTAILREAVELSKVEADEMAAAIGRVLPIASQMGVEFDQVAAALAAMTRTGLDANEGVTALRGLLVGILDPTQRAAEMMADYGLSVEQLQEAVREGNIVSVLQQLEAVFGDNTRALSVLFPNVRALVGAFNLVGERGEMAAAIFEDVADATEADLNAAFERTAQTLQFDLARAWATLSAALVKVGRTLAPIVSLVADLGGALGPAVELLPTLLAAFVAFKAAQFLPRLLSLISGALFRVSDAMVAAGGTSKAAVGVNRLGQSARGASASLAALGAGATLVATVGVGLLVAAWQEGQREAQQFEDAVASLSEIIRQHGDVTAEWTRLQMELNRLNIEGALAEEIRTKFAAALAEAESRVALETGRAADSARYAALAAAQANEQFEGGRIVLDQWSVAVGGVERGFRQLGLVMGTTTQQAMRAFTGAQLDPEKWKEFVREVKDALSDFEQALRESFDFAATALSKFSGKMHVNADKVLRELARQGRAAADYDANWTEVTRRAGGEADALLATIASMGMEGAGLLESLAGANRKQFDAIVRKWSNVKGESEQVVRNLKHTLVGGLEGMIRPTSSASQQVGQEMAAGLRRGIEMQAGLVAAAARNMVTDAIEAARVAARATSPSKLMAELGEDLDEGLRLGMLRDADKLARAATALVDAIREAIEEGLNRAHLEAARALDRATRDLERRFERLMDRVRSFKADIRSGFEQFDLIGGAMGLGEQLKQEAAAALQAQIEAAQEVGAPEATIAALQDQLEALTDAIVTPTAAQFGAFLADQLAQAQAFASGLESLQALGLSKSLLRQLAQQGPAGLPFIQALIAGGEDLVAQFNDTQAAIDQFAGSTADALAFEEFGKAVADMKDQMRGLLDQLEEMAEALKERALAREFEDLADAIEKLLRKLDLGGGGHVGGGDGNGRVAVEGRGILGAGITFNNYGSIMGLTKEELARLIRDEIVKLGRRNVTTGLPGG